MEVRASSSKFSSAKPQVIAQFEGNGSGRRIWRRRKLTKRDDRSRNCFERVPFLEEHVRKLKEGGSQVSADINRLMMSAESRYELVNEIAEAATEHIRNNKDKFGLEKKALYQAISDRLNESGIERPDAYYEPDPYKPPGLRDNLDHTSPFLW